MTFSQKDDEKRFNGSKNRLLTIECQDVFVRNGMKWRDKKQNVSGKDNSGPKWVKKPYMGGHSEQTTQGG